MNKNKLTFESEKLTVDWIGLKFQNLDNFTQKKLAKYLCKIGFNSYQQSGKLAKPIQESILINSKNKYEVLFIEEGPTHNTLNFILCLQWTQFGLREKIYSQYLGETK